MSTPSLPPDLLVLGFESSCDETGVAICNLRGEIVGQALHSQIAMHKDYGGVVPELASRDHIRRLYPLLQQALEQANITLNDIAAIGVTAGPGLPGALMAGNAFACALAFGKNLPIVRVHHLEGHLLSPLLSPNPPRFPFTALLVSGGHTQLMAAHNAGHYELLGSTLDDAVGEAFDKTAKMIGLPYPGGPALEKLARTGNAKRFALPRPMLHSKNLDFSFSGLKTAVLTTAMKLTGVDQPPETLPLSNEDKADLCASFQSAVTDVLTYKCRLALEQTGHQRLVVAGGVGANQALRQALTQMVETQQAEVFFPAPELCTDNGAMIAFAAATQLKRSPELLTLCDYTMTTHPRWSL